VLVLTTLSVALTLFGNLGPLTGGDAASLIISFATIFYLLRPRVGAAFSQ
jgi:hypothetical protein